MHMRKLLAADLPKDEAIIEYVLLGSMLPEVACTLVTLPSGVAPSPALEADWSKKKKRLQYRWMTARGHLGANTCVSALSLV